MYVIYEESGKFSVGRILSEAEASVQVELESGKRVKVKAAHLMIRFEQPAPAVLLPAAQALAQQVDLDLAWEFAPDEEFSCAQMAGLYFQDPPSLTQHAGMLWALQDAPHYFRRSGKGRFKKAPEDILQQALAAIEKKRQLTLQIDSWAKDLAEGRCPPTIRQQLYKILFKPDKNAPEYKAVVQAARQTQRAPLELLLNARAVASAYEFHWQRFLFDQFPKGTAFPDLFMTMPDLDLPRAAGQAFSIDDSGTTEIDDALSVHGLGLDQVTLGIHIAAPALAIVPGDAVDQWGRARLSTVYMPGHKITMLPDPVVQQFTLQAGRVCPALSLYVTLDAHSLDLVSHTTRIERLPVSHNLRHDMLDVWVTPDWLTSDRTTSPAAELPEPLAELKPELQFLYRLALKLKGQREAVRGKPENFNRPDFNFRLLDAKGPEPSGEEQVEISQRKRGAPLDLIVAEAMILANSTWGQWLNSLGVPAIYRSQASLAPGIKVRMGTKALPHAGIGVPAYAWSTSPLRRYTDLVNQWQILAAVRHGSTAALAAPFKPKDAELFAIISNFESAYAAYNAYQSSMERFWTLKYIQQQGLQELCATLIKDTLVRADDLPLVLNVPAVQDAARGARFLIRLGALDLMSLDIQGTVLQRLDLDAATGTCDALADDEDAEDPMPLALEVVLEDDPPHAPTTESGP